MLGGDNRSTYSSRQFDCSEVSGRKQIVLAGFIDDSQLAMRLGVSVGNYLVDFAALE